MVERSDQMTYEPAGEGLSAASFAKFSLIGRYLSKSLGTTHVPVQEFALQVVCRHLYQYICYCQYLSLVPLDPRELCERGCTGGSDLSPSIPDKPVLASGQVGLQITGRLSVRPV